MTEPRSASSLPRRWIFDVSMVALLAIGLVGGGLTLAQGRGDVYTGCINPNGNLVNVAVGSEPAGPGCNPSATQITWNETGPRGPRGRQGEPGPRGRRGPPGVTSVYEVASPMLEVRGPTEQTRVIGCDDTADVMTGAGYEILDNGTTTEILHVRPRSGRPDQWDVTIRHYPGPGLSEVTLYFLYGRCLDTMP